MKQKLLSLCLVLFLVLSLPMVDVTAQDQELYFNFPQEINQGELFYMTIALPRVQTVDAVQLYFAYDPSYFTFDASQSWLLQPGLEMNDGHNIHEEIYDANNAGLALIHWQGEYQTDANGTIAQLAFVAKQDAPVSTSLISLVYSANNVAPFVNSVEYGKTVEAEGFVMKIAVNASQLPPPQDEPIPPGEGNQNLGPATIPGEGTATGEVPGGDGTGLIGEAEPLPPQGNETPIPEATEPQPTEAPLPTEPHVAAEILPTDPETEVTHEPEKSPLRDVDGNELFVPTLSPPQSQIPNGFSLEKFKLHDLDIPAIHNRENGKIYYYLKRNNQSGFYSYNAGDDVFQAVDISGLLNAPRVNEKKSFDRTPEETRDTNPMMFAVVSLVGLGSLGLLLATVIRQIRR